MILIVVQNRQYDQINDNHINDNHVVMQVSFRYHIIITCTILDSGFPETVAKSVHVL